jgi:hypothetical protein
MRHCFLYHGGFERNFSELKPGAQTFHGSDGSERALGDWSPDVDGVRVGYMEKPGKRFVAVRVMGGTADVVLQHEVLLDGPRHMGYGKRFSAEPIVIEDDGLARQLLDDIIARNPDQRSTLSLIRDRIPKGRQRTLR